jgi:serine/threonine protein kinase
MHSLTEVILHHFALVIVFAPCSCICHAPAAVNGVEQSIIVLEYVEFDLSALLELGSERLSFSRSQLKCIMKQILEGLSSLSSCGLMHRDLKVMNVLISASGHTKLGDLGSATSFVSRSRFSSEVCTLWYRAPELLLGCEQYDSKVDIWSAAVVFVELCLCTNFVRSSTAEAQFIELVKFFGVPADVNEFRSSLGPRSDEMLAWSTAACQADDTSSSSACATWEKLSSRLGAEGIDLLKRMFSFNPSKRPSAQDCLQHPFFSSYPASAPRVMLPNGLEELHAFEHASARLRKEQQEQSQQLQQLQRKRAEAQSSRKLSPEHNPSVADMLHALLTPNTAAVPVDVPSESSFSVVRKPRKNLSVSFALERNEQQFYSPSDAPCQVAAARSRKRNRPTSGDDAASDNNERPTKFSKLFDPDPATQEELHQPSSRSLPKVVIRNGTISLSAPSREPAPHAVSASVLFV